MRAKREFRDRPDTEVAVLDALADRREEGMSVFELRSHVEADIDDLEAALADLKADGLIEVTDDADRTVIRPDERVVGPAVEETDESLFEAIRRRLRL